MPLMECGVGFLSCSRDCPGGLLWIFGLFLSKHILPLLMLGSHVLTLIGFAESADTYYQEPI